MDLLKAKEAFSATLNGVPVMVSKDEVVTADDPVVKGREGGFKPVEASKASQGRVAAAAASGGRRGRRAGRVEEATANPGERRNITPPAVEGEGGEPPPEK